MQTNHQNMQTIGELISGLVFEGSESALQLVPNSIQYDSRKLQKDDLFVAISGYKVDGHRFVESAQQTGSVAAIVEKNNPKLVVPQIKVQDTREALAQISYNYYKEDIDRLKLVGITGTNGKTTTSYLVRSILNAAGLDPGLIGTIAYHYAGQVVEAWNTTPESLDICKILDVLSCNNQKACVLEVSSHALELKRVESLRFDAAVFMNLSRDHLDFHRTDEDYFQAKKKLFSLMRKDATAIINIDDDYGKRLAEELTCSKITFGFAEQAELRIDDWKQNEHGMTLRLSSKQGSLEIGSKLISAFNVQNITAAVGVGLALNMGVPAIKNGIEQVDSVPGRLQNVNYLSPIKVYVDYAHTPDALQKALDALKEITVGRLIVVFGAGGDRDQGKRPKMGTVAERMSDFAIVTSDNPRSELPDKIIEQILEGMIEKKNYEITVDRREAIFRAVQIAKPGDVVLIAGKGHENYQEINGVRHPFDDVNIAKEALADA